MWRSDYYGFKQTMWCENGKQISLASSTHIVTAHDPTPFGSRHMACACRCHLSLRPAPLSFPRCVCAGPRAYRFDAKKPLCQRHFSERHFQKTVKPGGPGKRDASLTCYLLLTPPGRNGNAARTAAGSRPETTHAATTSAPPTTHCGSSPSPRSSSPKALAQSGSVATMTDAADCGTCASVRGRGWRGARCGEGAGGWEGRPATAAVWQRCGGGRGKEPPPASALSSRRPARGRW